MSIIEKDSIFGIEVNIKLTDTPDIVRQKNEKAIDQYLNPIEGEYEVIEEQKALLDLKCD